MNNKIRWQVPGNANPFDGDLKDYTKNIISQRSIGVLKFILDNNNFITKKQFEIGIKDYLFNLFQHQDNKSLASHFYRPLEFVGLIRNTNDTLSVSIDGRNFIKYIEKENYQEAKHFYLLQMLKAKYPNTATKDVKELKLFPFRIIFKMIIDKNLTEDDFRYKIPYISSIDDIKNFDSLPKLDKYEKWKSWCISYLIKWNVLFYTKDKIIKFSKDIEDFITAFILDMTYEDMFFKEENEQILTNKIKSIKSINRNQKIIDEVILNSNFKCFINPLHITFASNTRENYVEGHHIIPLSLQESFKDNNLDIKDNIVPLCPNCHKAFHFGTKKVKTDYINILFSKGEKLKSLDINYNDLLEIYL